MKYISLKVATVLTVYGIETSTLFAIVKFSSLSLVATVLTVYGIETKKGLFLKILKLKLRCNSTYRLRY